MDSLKFQLSKEHKRKEKTFWVFTAFFIPFITLVGMYYTEGENFTWKFFWIGIITLSISILFMGVIFYFLMFFRKPPNYWTEIEFTDHGFIVPSIFKKDEFSYSKIIEVVFYESRDNKLFYIKMIVPTGNHYILGFEEQEQIIQIIKEKSKEYGFAIRRKIRLINKSSFTFRVLVLALGLTLWIIIYPLININ